MEHEDRPTEYLAEQKKIRNDCQHNWIRTTLLFCEIETKTRNEKEQQQKIMKNLFRSFFFLSSNFRIDFFWFHPFLEIPSFIIINIIIFFILLSTIRLHMKAYRSLMVVKLEIRRMAARLRCLYEIRNAIGLQLAPKLIIFFFCSFFVCGDTNVHAIQLE